MKLTAQIQDVVLAETQQAARRVAWRYERRDKDGWRKSWGFVYLNVTDRIGRMSELPGHFEFWLRRTALGEAHKYYRAERSASLV